MEGERIETAVQRIEKALARIAELADRQPEPQASSSAPGNSVPGNSVNVSQLVVRHEELRETVATELRNLDDIIARLGE